MKISLPASARFLKLAIGWIFRVSRSGRLASLLSLGAAVPRRIVKVSERSGALVSMAKTSRVARVVWQDGKLLNLAPNSLSRLSFSAWSGSVLSPNRRGGFLLKGNRLLVQDSGLPGVPKLYFPNTDVGGILEQTGETVLMRRMRAKRGIDKGIFAGSMAPHNWFHWVIDTLPTIYHTRYLPREYRDFPLLVPDIALNRTNWCSALDLVADGREIIGVSEAELYRVARLVWLEGVTKSNPHSQVGPVRGRISVQYDLLREYRDFLVSELLLDEVVPELGRKIFLSRREHEVRRYNHKEILSLLVGRGFEEIFLEEFDFRDSLKLFLSAETVVGPHGAGWANLLFASPRTRALMWTWPGRLEDNWYQNIGWISGVHYREIHTTTLEAEPGQRAVDPRIADYYLPPPLLLANLSAIE